MQATTRITVQSAAATSALVLLLAAVALPVTEKVRFLTRQHQSLDSLFSEVATTEVSGDKPLFADAMTGPIGQPPRDLSDWRLLPIPPGQFASDRSLGAVPPVTLPMAPRDGFRPRRLAKLNDNFLQHPPAAFGVPRQPMGSHFAGEVVQPPPPRAPEPLLPGPEAGD